MARSSQTEQIRGICQCCGREQAVVGGRMSKHGYTVENGFFDGVCRGERYAPLEVSRAQLDLTCEYVAEQVQRARENAEALRSGAVKPATVTTSRAEWVTIHGRQVCRALKVPFAEGTASQQAEAVRMAIFNAERRAEMGEGFIADLQRLAAEYHGKELRTVAKQAAPEAIRIGERRKLPNGCVATVRSVEGARVHWNMTREGQDKPFRGWTGTTAFRKLPKVD